MKCCCCWEYFEPSEERIKDFPESLDPPTCTRCFIEIYNDKMKKMKESIEKLEKENDEIRGKLNE